jgi:hypothetical protein
MQFFDNLTSLILSSINRRLKACTKDVHHKKILQFVFSQTWHAQRLYGHLVSGEVIGSFDKPFSFSVHVSKSFWKKSRTIKKLLGEKAIWFEEHTKFQSTFKTLSQLIETQRMASKCQYSLFQVEVKDDLLENPLEISITRSPVKRRPRLGDQNDVRATCQVSFHLKFYAKAHIVGIELT